MAYLPLWLGLNSKLRKSKSNGRRACGWVKEVVSSGWPIQKFQTRYTVVQYFHFLCRILRNVETVTDGSTSILGTWSFTSTLSHPKHAWKCSRFELQKTFYLVFWITDRMVCSCPCECYLNYPVMSENTLQFSIVSRQVSKNNLYVGKQQNHTKWLLFSTGPHSFHC